MKDELLKIREEIDQEKKKLSVLKNHCDLKKKELEEYKIAEGQRNKEAERLYSSLLVKVEEVKKDINIKSHKVIVLDDTLIKQKKELSAIGDKLKSVQIEKDNLNEKTRKVLALEASLFTKQGEVNELNKVTNDRAKRLELDRTILELAMKEASDKSHTLDLRENDATQKEKNAELLEADAILKAQKADKMLSETIKLKNEAVEDLEGAKAKEKNASDYCAETIILLQEASSTFAEAKASKQENESILKGLKNFEKELDYKKLQIDAIVRRKNIDEGKLGRK